MLQIHAWFQLSAQPETGDWMIFFPKAVKLLSDPLKRSGSYYQNIFVETE